MFETSKMFNGMFGKIEPGKCRLTMKGGIAVRCANGSYKTYNLKKGTLTNVTNFCLNLGDEMFFVIPTNKVANGDIILVDGKPKCVIGSDKKTIQVIDYESSEIKTILPERHIFMGNVYFYGKIVSMFGNAFKGGNGLKGMMKFALMSQMMSGMMGNGSSSSSAANMFGGANGGMMGAFAPLMMMNMLGGKDGENPFDGMFGEMSFDLLGEDVDDESETTEEEED